MATPPGSEADLVANVGDRVLYGYNKSVLSIDADATLNRQSKWLAKYPAVKILIAGNADERGTETYNLALGQRRANAARDDLIAQGIAASRIQTISYGKDCPIAPGQQRSRLSTKPQRHHLGTGRQPAELLLTRDIHAPENG